jgi:hypothetical protein
MAKAQANLKSSAALAPLRPSKRALEKALRISAGNAQRIADAFGLKVPGHKVPAAKCNAIKGVGA